MFVITFCAWDAADRIEIQNITFFLDFVLNEICMNLENIFKSMIEMYKNYHGMKLKENFTLLYQIL